eukprot:6551-Heterococcus_DN1.PRE.2
MSPLHSITTSTAVELYSQTLQDIASKKLYTTVQHSTRLLAHMQDTSNTTTMLCTSTTCTQYYC